MAAKLDIYKCNICGNIVEVVHGGDGELVCCGQPMLKLLAKTSEQEGKEKHVPVVERDGDSIRVKVGSVPHPMEEKHHIEWVELVADGKTYREFFEPGKPAEAVFNVQAERIAVREYCNVHGLWKG